MSITNEQLLILNDLKAVFPPVVSDFYEGCFEEIRKAVNKLIG